MAKVDSIINKFNKFIFNKINYSYITDCFVQSFIYLTINWLVILPNYTHCFLVNILVILGYIYSIIFQGIYSQINFFKLELDLPIGHYLIAISDTFYWLRVDKLQGIISEIYLKFCWQIYLGIIQGKLLSYNQSQSFHMGPTS